MEEFFKNLGFMDVFVIVTTILGLIYGGGKIHKVIKNTSYKNTRDVINITGDKISNNKDSKIHTSQRDTFNNNTNVTVHNNSEKGDHDDI